MSGSILILQQNFAFDIALFFTLSDCCIFLLVFVWFVWMIHWRTEFLWNSFKGNSWYTAIYILSAFHFPNTCRELENLVFIFAVYWNCDYTRCILFLKVSDGVNKKERRSVCSQIWCCFKQCACSCSWNDRGPVVLEILMTLTSCRATRH